MLRTIFNFFTEQTILNFKKPGVNSPVVPYSAVSPRATGDNGARYLAALSSSAHKYVTDSLNTLSLQSYTDRKNGKTFYLLNGLSLQTVKGKKKLKTVFFICIFCQ